MTEIQGTCTPEFNAVKDAFAKNLESGMEIGCSVAVTVGEEYAVDLWGGYKDEARTEPWERDTVVMVASSTKIPVALAGLMLIEQGLVAPDDPVAKHWPEFGQNGKENVTFRHLMTHSSGIPAPWPPVPFSTFFDWEAITTHLSKQAPWWEPGTEFGYHMHTFGFLVGEVVRRVTGRTPGVYLREEVFDRIGADFQIGFPKSEFGRMARLTPVDLAPRVEDLPATPVHPERVVGIWSGNMELMGQPASSRVEITSGPDGLDAVIIRKMHGGEFRPTVEDVRFDGECLRMRASVPGGLMCWDCHLSGSDMLDVTAYGGGQSFQFFLHRGEESTGEIKSGDELSLRMSQSVLPPEWKGSPSLTSEIPSSNGVGNARSLARIGAVMANGGSLAGHRFLSQETVDLAVTEQIYRESIGLSFGKIRYGFGFGLNSEEFACPSDRSLHWGGAGGSVCIMDLDSRTSFAYVMNGMLASSKFDPRNQRLRAAYHRSLGKPADFDLAGA